MKQHLAFLTVFGSLLFVCSLAAPTPASEEITVESLKARIGLANEHLLIIYEVIESRGHGFLLGAVKNLQHSIGELSRRLDRHDTQFYLGQYAAQLKRYEERIQEEISNVLTALNNHKRVDSTKAALILVGHELVDKANAVIKHHNHDSTHGHIFEEMKSEIDEINKLINKIGAAPEVTENDSKQLYRHELTMSKLLGEFHTTK